MDPSQTPLADYEIEEEIGLGNLTIVYRARRRSDRRLVTIKMVVSEFTTDRLFVRRFVDAAGRAKRLDHPNIAQVYDAGQREDVVYVAREFIEAESLADWLKRRGPLSPMQATPIIRQLASALDYAHDRRLMHGDVNDQCIFIDQDEKVILADFGLTQAVYGTDLSKSVSRRVQMVSGTGAPAYLAPERVQGQSPSRPADIYSLGMVAYQLLVGEVPFLGDSETVMEAQVYQTPPPLDSVNRKLPSSTSAAVARALSKRPELRYNTATEFARAFGAAAEGIAPGRGSVTVASSGSSKSRAGGRPRLWPFLVALVVGLILIVLVWNISGWGKNMVDQLAEWVPSPAPVSSPSAEGTPAVVVVEPGEELPTLTAMPASSPAPTAALATSTPTPVPTPTSIPAAGSPSVEQGSPFSNLILAGDISDDHEPVSPATEFSVGHHRVYLFFDYRNIAAGSSWGHAWLLNGEEIERASDTWPDDWGAAGRAWIFYTPVEDYEPGSYQVQLLVGGEIVASADFVVQ